MKVLWGKTVHLENNEKIEWKLGRFEEEMNILRQIGNPPSYNEYQDDEKNNTLYFIRRMEMKERDDIPTSMP